MTLARDSFVSLASWYDFGAKLMKTKLYKYVSFHFDAITLNIGKKCICNNHQVPLSKIL